MENKSRSDLLKSGVVLCSWRKSKHDCGPHRPEKKSIQAQRLTYINKRVNKVPLHVPHAKLKRKKVFQAAGRHWKDVRKHMKQQDEELPEWVPSEAAAESFDFSGDKWPLRDEHFVSFMKHSRAGNLSIDKVRALRFHKRNGIIIRDSNRIPPEKNSFFTASLAKSAIMVCATPATEVFILCV